MTADGGSLQPVTSDSGSDWAPDWSPDGRRLVFYSNRSGRDELYVVARDSGGAWGAPVQITHGGGERPRWSPRGDVIAYVSGPDLRLVSPEGRERPPVLSFVRGTATPVWLAWLPDGRTLYYDARDAEGGLGFWSVSLSGAKSRMLVIPDDPSKASARSEFSTDGRRLFFTITDTESDIWIADIMPH